MLITYYLDYIILYKKKDHTSHLYIIEKKLDSYMYVFVGNMNKILCDYRNIYVKNMDIEKVLCDIIRENRLDDLINHKCILLDAENYLYIPFVKIIQTRAILDCIEQELDIDLYLYDYILENITKENTIQKKKIIKNYLLYTSFAIILVSIIALYNFYKFDQPPVDHMTQLIYISMFVGVIYGLVMNLIYLVDFIDINL
jgi:hypothetical protein